MIKGNRIVIGFLTAFLSIQLRLEAKIGYMKINFPNGFILYVRWFFFFFFSHLRHNIQCNISAYVTRKSTQIYLN